MQFKDDYPKAREVVLVENYRSGQNILDKSYEFIKHIYKNLYKKNPVFGMEEILELLAKHPELEEINKHILRNEGYQKSLKEDKIPDSDNRKIG